MDIQDQEELHEILIKLASSLNEEDLADPATYGLAKQLVQMLEPSAEPLPQELVDQLEKIKDKITRFKMAAQAMGANSPESMDKLVDSMKSAGLWKGEINFISDMPINMTYRRRNTDFAQKDALADDAHGDSDLKKITPAAPQAHNDHIRNIADSYAESKGIKLQHDIPKVKVNPEYASKVASAYHNMPHNPSHPETKEAYSALIEETTQQLHHLQKNGYKFTPIKQGEPNPYAAGSSALISDLRNNKHAHYYPTDQGFGSSDAEYSNHPMLKMIKDIHGNEMPANDAFRIVHDVFGHGKEGHTFGPNGEEAAYRHHYQMYSPLARRALTAETRGQNSWVNFGPHAEHNRSNPKDTKYADQKAGLLPSWAEEHYQNAEPMAKGQNGDWEKDGYTLSHEDDGETFSVKAHKDGKEVAEAELWRRKYPEYMDEAAGKAYLHPARADVETEHRRKGLASAMYAHAEKTTGLKIDKLKSHQSKDAQDLWSNPNRSFGKSEKNTDHDLDKPEELNELSKMSRPRIGFPNFEKLNSRPDQEVQTIESPRQKNIFGRKVVNARGQSKNIPSDKKYKIKGDKKIYEDKASGVEALSNKISSLFNRNTTGLSSITPNGPMSAALAGAERSKHEGSDDYQNKIKAHNEKCNEIIKDHNKKIEEFNNKTKELLNSGTKDEKIIRDHINSRPQKPKLPRAPSKKRINTKDLSQDMQAARGRAVDSTIEHEAFHHTMSSIARNYGAEAYSKVKSGLLSHFNKDTLSAVGDYISGVGYKKNNPHFDEELLTHSRDILVNPKKRESFKNFVGDKADAHIKNLKEGHQKAYEWAKKVKPEDVIKKSESLDKGINGDWENEGYKFKTSYSKKRGYAIFAYKDKARVGHLVFYDRPDKDGYHPVYNSNIDEGHQGKGIYQEMIKQGIKKAISAGAKGIKSEGFQRSKEATRAWEKINPEIKEDAGRINFYANEKHLKKAEDPSSYAKIASKGFIIAHPVKINGAERRHDNNIKYHATVKFFDKDGDNEDEAHQTASKLDLTPPNPKETHIEPKVLKDRYGNDVYSFGLKGPHADRLKENHKKFSHMGHAENYDWTPHVSVPKSVYQEIVAAGHKTAHDAGFEFGPAELMRGEKVLNTYKDSLKKSYLIERDFSLIINDLIKSGFNNQALILMELIENGNFMKKSHSDVGSAMPDHIQKIIKKYNNSPIPKESPDHQQMADHINGMLQGGKRLEARRLYENYISGERGTYLARLENLEKRSKNVRREIDRINSGKKGKNKAAEREAKYMRDVLAVDKSPKLPSISELAEKHFGSKSKEAQSKVTDDQKRSAGWKDNKSGMPIRKPEITHNEKEGLKVTHLGTPKSIRHETAHVLRTDLSMPELNEKMQGGYGKIKSLGAKAKKEAKNSGKTPAEISEAERVASPFAHQGEYETMGIENAIARRTGSNPPRSTVSRTRPEDISRFGEGKKDERDAVQIGMGGAKKDKQIHKLVPEKTAMESSIVRRDRRDSERKKATDSHNEAVAQARKQGLPDPKKITASDAPGKMAHISSLTENVRPHVKEMVKERLDTKEIVYDKKTKRPENSTSANANINRRASGKEPIYNKIVSRGEDGLKPISFNDMKKSELSKSWEIKIKGKDGYHPVKDVVDQGFGKKNAYILHDGTKIDSEKIEDLRIGDKNAKDSNRTI